MSIRKVQTKNGPKWEAYFWVSGKGSKRIRRRFDRKIDAQEFEKDFWERQKELQESNSTISNPEELTFANEAEVWLEASEARFSAGHVKRAKGILKQILPELGKLTIDKFGPTFLASFQKEQLRRGLKNGTVNRYTEVITAIINHSYQHRRISFNPTVGFKKLPSSTQEMKFWERSEAESFLDFANKRHPKGSDSRWVYVVYLLALSTGLRAGEIWGLKVCDLVEDGQTLFIRRQFSLVTKKFELPKGKKSSKRGRTSRHVPCPPNLRQELQDLAKRDGLGKDDLFFRGQTGKPLNHTSFANRFKRDQKLWEGEQIRFHDLRHTAITLFISEGVDLRTVQAIAGHEDISTTMGYTHLIGDNIRRVAGLFSIGENKKEVGVFKFDGGKQCFLRNLPR